MATVSKVKGWLVPVPEPPAVSPLVALPMTCMCDRRHVRSPEDAHVRLQYMDSTSGLASKNGVP